MHKENKYIDLKGTYNFRDIGGYKGFEDRYIKYGLHYRSDELSHLSEADTFAVQKLGINTIIDYRNDKERKNNEDVPIEGIEVIYIDPVADIAALASSEQGEKVSDQFDMKRLTAQQAKYMMTEQNKVFVDSKKSQKAYREMFDLVLDEDRIIVQHCRGGKDRTGYGVALILLLLGVSREDVLHDYMLTNTYKRVKNETSLAKLLEETQNEDFVQAVRYFKEANESFLTTALDKIDHEYGGVEAYVKSVLGMSDEHIAKLRERYLEK